MLVYNKDVIEKLVVNATINKLSNPKIMNTVVAKLLQLQEQQLERQILLEHSKQSIRLTENDIREFYKQALTLEPKMLINLFVKEITLFDDKIAIQFNSPSKASPDTIRGFSFYSETVEMIVSQYANTAPCTQKIQLELYI